MRTRAVAGFLVTGLACFFGSSSFAQQTLLGPPLRLDDPALFPASPLPSFWASRSVTSGLSFAWTVPASTLPSYTAMYQPSMTARTRSPANFSDRLADWAPKLDYATGEIGFLYGHSAGKYSADFKEAYIMGEVGNDHLQITAGAAFQDSSFRFPRGHY
ncbi:MAG: hypothetical protein JO354_03715 [Verrucomicrobia bacterium]|nr:hypothetical protein [Verrucomicrobiota bacterium]